MDPPFVEQPENLDFVRASFIIQVRQPVIHLIFVRNTASHPPTALSHTPADQEEQTYRRKQGRLEVLPASIYITGHVIDCDDLRYEAIGRARNRADGRLGCTSGIVEVYPAAALEIWGLSGFGYKDKDKDKASGELRKLVYCLGILTYPWLRVALISYWSTLASKDDAFDALICALMARLASLPGGPTCPYRRTFTSAQMDLFRSEGWIHLPPLAPTLCYLDPANIPYIGQCPQCGG